MSKKKKKNKKLKLPVREIFLEVPRNALSVTVSAKVPDYETGEVLTVKYKLDQIDLLKLHLEYIARRNYVDLKDDEDLEPSGDETPRTEFFFSRPLGKPAPQAPVPPAKQKTTPKKTPSAKKPAPKKPPAKKSSSRSKPKT